MDVFGVWQTKSMKARSSSNKYENLAEFQSAGSPDKEMQTGWLRSFDVRAE